jgi:putative DNA primase/helicase
LNDRLSTLELINQQGRKTALYGGANAGGYWAAQTLPEGDGQGVTLLIVEGVATVLSAKEATRHAVIATLSCCNLENVAKQMRERYPAAAAEQAFLAQVARALAKLARLVQVLSSR